MSLYETLVLARQDISTTQVEALIEALTGLITENGGSVANTEYWGLRNLAYRIKKNRKGHYVLFHIDAPSAAVAEMERTMRLNDDVLRYMSLKVDEFPDGPSVQMKARSNRDRDRDDRGGDRGGDRRDRPSDKPAQSEGEAS